MTDDEEPTPVRPRRSPFESDERRGTSPIALLERDLDPRDHAIAERVREKLAESVVNLAHVIERDRRRKERDSDELSNQVAVAIDEQRKATDWLRDNVKSLLESRSRTTKIGGALAGGVVAALVVIGQMLWARAEDEGQTKNEMHHIQKAQEKQGQQIEEILRRIYSKDNP